MIIVGGWHWRIICDSWTTWRGTRRCSTWSNSWRHWSPCQICISSHLEPYKFTGVNWLRLHQGHLIIVSVCLHHPWSQAEMKAKLMLCLSCHLKSPNFCLSFGQHPQCTWISLALYSVVVSTEIAFSQVIYLLNTIYLITACQLRVVYTDSISRRVHRHVPLEDVYITIVSNYLNYRLHE